MSGSRSTGGREFQDDGPDDENARGVVVSYVRLSDVLCVDL